MGGFDLDDAIDVSIDGAADQLEGRTTKHWRWP